MIGLYWFMFVGGFAMVGTLENYESLQNIGMIIMLYGLGMAIYTMIRKPQPKQQQVVVQQIQTDTGNEGEDNMKQNVKIEQNASIGKMSIKRDMKKDSQIFKLIKLGMILGVLVGVAIMGIETVKSLALVILIVLGCIIALFLFIALPLMIVFKDTIKLFISKKN